MGKVLPTRPELYGLVGHFMQEHQLAPPATQDPVPESEGAARLTAAVNANQACGRSKPLGKGKGDADYSTYFVLCKNSGGRSHLVATCKWKLWASPPAPRVAPH